MLDAVDEALKSWSEGWDSLVNRFGAMKDSVQMVVRGIQTASGMYQKYKKKKTARQKSKPEDEV